MKQTLEKILGRNRWATRRFTAVWLWFCWRSFRRSLVFTPQEPCAAIVRKARSASATTKRDIIAVAANDAAPTSKD